MIRPLSKSDINQLLEVENVVHISPWDQETFATCFNPGFTGWGVELDNKIIGFVIVSLTLEECHVLNLAVMHEFQHHGVGRQLMETALMHAKEKGIKIAYLEVRKSNTHAISLYQHMQFQLIGQREKYYPGAAGSEDAFIFALDLHTYRAL